VRGITVNFSYLDRSCDGIDVEERSALAAETVPDVPVPRRIFRRTACVTIRRRDHHYGGRVPRWFKHTRVVVLKTQETKVKKVDRPMSMDFLPWGFPCLCHIEENNKVPWFADCGRDFNKLKTTFEGTYQLRESWTMIVDVLNVNLNSRLTRMSQIFTDSLNRQFQNLKKISDSLNGQTVHDNTKINAGIG